ncbi:hypothetical protein OF855_24685 [Mycolicibacterium fortuitum]|uniref:hypothetical protein n=1 Tax=Mycolicibacterium fortuitum TaxID=1766 RepID=UPI0022BA1388|nr:hypothetical protein [Mycolicibacterium fortuitum]WAY18437.1 hypothetical protein OF855_24685 [Mycolicibacterium fortuitum]
MSFCENVSELYRELRTAAGTVLTTLGSRMEADARAQVDEVGPQWLTEFEDEICDEADRCEYAELTPEVALGICPTWPCTPACHSTSAAVSAAADPSPTVPSPSPASVGGEGRKEDSCILPPASFRHPTDPGEVSAPSPGERVREDDLAAHIMGDFVSGQEVDPLTATLIDALSSRIASALLTDFTIIRRA